MVYGYARCSTNESKQDIDRQTKELKAKGADVVFCEYEHGDAATKKELNKLLEIIKPGDTLLTLEVSRLSRSTQQLCSLIDTVKQKRIRLEIVGSVVIDCRNGELDPMTKAFLQMAGVFSELELSMIRARVRSGMANAAAKGKKIGRPAVTAETVPEAFLRYYPRYKSGSINKVEFAKLAELSRPSINKYIKLVEQRKEVRL